MKKVLTIAVPAYNSESYLDKCLTSFLAPEAIDKLEIIVINDGSTDNTGKIADSYAGKYPDSIFVIHKENAGHGSGINVAASRASGKYFRVVDADDWVLTEHLGEYIRQLEETDADVFITGFHTVDMSTGKRRSVTIPKEHHGKTCHMRDVMKIFNSVKNCFTIHGIAYKMDEYVKSGVVLSEKIFYEDNEFTTLPFSRVETVFFSDLILYQYLVGNVAQSISSRNLVARLPHLDAVLWRIIGFYSDNTELMEPVRQYILEKLAGVVTTYEITCLLKNPDRTQGKRLAEALKERLEREFPVLIPYTEGAHKRIVLLHRLRINGGMLDAVMDSRPYIWLRDKLRK